MDLKTLIWAIYKNEDDQLVVNYIHRGSIDILNEYFNDIDRIKDLFSYGNVAKLAPKLEPENGEETEYDPETWDPEVCVFFHRDYGDPEYLCDIEYFKGEKEFLEDWKVANYLFFFINGRWNEIDLKESRKRGLFCEVVPD